MSSPTTAPAVASRLRSGAATTARRHGIFAAALIVAAAVRVIAMLGYPGPLLFPDSGAYLKNSLDLVPGPLRPAGYPIFLRALDFTHSLTAVADIQHLLGLAIAGLGYALLRHRFALPGWGATLAMVPVLFSAYEIQLEHFLLSDTLFAVLVMVAVVALLWQPVPSLWACALAGLALAAAAVVRTQGVPLLFIFVACLLIRWAGWRTIAGIAVLCVAFAAPVIGYAGWYDASNGSFELGANDGAFFYSEAVTFANCAVIHPPANLRWLCPRTPLSQRVPDSNHYLWGHRSLLDKLPGKQFSDRANTLGLEFAFDAIRAQPTAYLRSFLGNFTQSFLPHTGNPRIYSPADEANKTQHDYMFPAGAPVFPLVNWTPGFVTYTGAPQDFRHFQPWAGWIQGYQRYVVLSGPELGLIALAGLAGLIACWRRIGGPALLPWLTGMALLVIPALVTFDVRYLLCAVPVLCLSAAIGISEITGRVTAARRISGPAGRLPSIQYNRAEEAAT